MNQFPTKEYQNECELKKDDLIDKTYNLYFKYSKQNALLIYYKVKGKHPSTSAFCIFIPTRIKQIKDYYAKTTFAINYPQYLRLIQTQLNTMLSYRQVVHWSCLLYLTHYQLEKYQLNPHIVLNYMQSIAKTMPGRCLH